MGMVEFKGGGGYYAPIMCILLTILIVRATASVVLLGKNVSLSFDDIEANFAPTIKGSGERGVLYLAEPPGACSSLTNKVVELPSSPFTLIMRGGCEFDEKVRNAQNAGFKAAIVYDNEDNDILVSMAGSSGGIKIHAIFVSKATGEVLKKYSGLTNMELWIIPTFENTTWSILTISFISLLAISAVLATCFFVRRQRIRHERPRAPHVREFHGMSSQLVKAMPSLIFSSVLEDNCTSRSCAICLEDYNVGEKLRVLPCRHKFHALCVDSWLTAWRTFCPVCKRDANTSAGDPPASERTPLLSSDPAPQSSTAGLSSFHSSAAASSPAIQIDPSPVQSLAAPQTHPQRSFCNSPPFCRSRSADLISMSPQRSRASHLLSSRSLGMPSSPPTNSRSGSPYVHGPSSGFPSYIPTL